jgi:hypothetical protein
MKGEKLNILINFWLHLGTIYRNLAKKFQILNFFFSKGFHNGANFREKKLPRLIIITMSFLRNF